MATFTRLEEINAWVKSRELNAVIYKFINEGSFQKDFSLRNQINRSSGSVMDNIAEGFERGGKNEFINFLGIARGSLGEVKSQLFRALDRKHITEQNFKTAHNIAEETGRLITGLISYLNQSDIRGLKYKDRDNSAST